MSFKTYPNYALVLYMYCFGMVLVRFGMIGDGVGMVLVLFRHGVGMVSVLFLGKRFKQDYPDFNSRRYTPCKCEHVFSALNDVRQDPIIQQNKEALAAVDSSMRKCGLSS